MYLHTYDFWTQPPYFGILNSAQHYPRYTHHEKPHPPPLFFDTVCKYVIHIYMAPRFPVRTHTIGPNWMNRTAVAAVAIAISIIGIKNSRQIMPERKLFSVFVPAAADIDT